MQRHLLACAILAALNSSAYAQTAPTTSTQIPLSYVGTNTQLALGIDQDGEVAGGATFVFGETGRSNWLAQAWLANGGAGGLQMDYHWLWNGKSLDDAINKPDSVTVAKAFIAVDQNVFDDQKISLGLGWEREAWFVDAYVSQNLSGARLQDSVIDERNRVLTGTLNGRPFRQTETTTTTTDIFAKPYEDGVGARVGRFFENPLLRVRAGFDYEDGQFNANQKTFSLGAEKFFRNSPHSLALEGEWARKSGQFEIDRSDSRALLSYRYDFGSNFRANTLTRDVEVKKQVLESIPGESQIVKNEIRIDAESFFNIDSAKLNDAALSALDQVIDTIKSDKRISRVSVFGHTCDLGNADYNQALSERRAFAVRDFFGSRDIDLNELDVAGKGETEPKYPNEKNTRSKNRRVDVSFLTVEEKSIAGEPRSETKQVIEWVKEPVAAPAAWIERALRNPSAHKRSVDVYRFEKARIETTLGPVEFINRAPIAVDDVLIVNRNSGPNVLLPLSNDSDSDGDLLTPTGVTQPSNGTADFAVGGLMQYTPRPGFVGTDSFTYSISDGRGGTATATVRVTVRNGAPVANNDNATTFKNQILLIDAIANDTDADGEALSLVSVSGALNGVANIVNGRIRYVPNTGFAGTDTLTYVVSDASGATSTAQIVVTVVNRAPIAVNDSVRNFSAQFINVISNDSDPDNDPIKVTAVTQGANGGVTIRPDGTVLYIPNPGWCGVDTFTYTITDSSNATATATVSVETLD